MNPPRLDAKEEEASRPQEPASATASETNSPPGAPLSMTEMAVLTVTAPPEPQVVKRERDIPSEHAPATKESDRPSENATVSTEVGLPPKRTPARKKPKLTPVIRPVGFVIIDNAIKFFSEGDYSPSRLRTSWGREQSTKSEENNNESGEENFSEQYPFPTPDLPSLNSNDISKNNCRINEESDEIREEAKQDACSSLSSEKVT